MAIEQFTYTGSPWGYTAPGWTVFQRSPGISPNRAESFSGIFGYSGEDGDPVQFVHIADKGETVLSQSLDSGLRWYDKNRGHDYFAHVFAGPSPDDRNGLPSPDFTPMSLYMSSAFQREFPEDLRGKAQEVFDGKRANSEPPHLEQLDSFFDIPQNPDFRREAVARRIPAGGLEKIPSIAESIKRRMERKPGAKAVRFDGRNPHAADTMALALSLLPPDMRMRANFATWMSPAALESMPGFANLDFYGTDLPAGCNVDPDTGVADYSRIDGMVRLTDAGELLRLASRIDRNLDDLTFKKPKPQYNPSAADESSIPEPAQWNDAATVELLRRRLHAAESKGGFFSYAIAVCAGIFAGIALCVSACIWLKPMAGAGENADAKALRKQVQDLEADLRNARLSAESARKEDGQIEASGERNALTEQEESQKCDGQGSDDGSDSQETRGNDAQTGSAAEEDAQTGSVQEEGVQTGDEQKERVQTGEEQKERVQTGEEQEERVQTGDEQEEGALTGNAQAVVTDDDDSDSDITARMLELKKLQDDLDLERQHFEDEMKSEKKKLKEQNDQLDKKKKKLDDREKDLKKRKLELDQREAALLQRETAAASASGKGAKSAERNNSADGGSDR